MDNPSTPSIARKLRQHLEAIVRSPRRAPLSPSDADVRSWVVPTGSPKKQQSFFNVGNAEPEDPDYVPQAVPTGSPRKTVRPCCRCVCPMVFSASSCVCASLFHCECVSMSTCACALRCTCVCLCAEARVVCATLTDVAHVVGAALLCVALCYSLLNVIARVAAGCMLCLRVTTGAQAWFGTPTAERATESGSTRRQLPRAALPRFRTHRQ